MTARVLPSPMHPPGGAARCVVLVDGEHYPTAVADAIADLRAGGWDVACAALVGGGEKLRGEPDYGVHHVTGPDPASALRAAIELGTGGGALDAVVDLGDEPVLVFERRLELIGLAAGRGLRYVMADSAFDPPSFERVAMPTLAITGTGKRIGKTAVSAHAARVIDAHLGGDGAVVVVAMGRGGPAQPVVVDRGSGSITVETLLEISRSGAHAASDYLEDAALTGLTTVGCRRVSGGLLGVPASSNVPEGAHLAASLASQLVLLEGSGSCIPPVHADATMLLASTARPHDLLDGLGPFRLGRSDMLLVMGDDRDTAARMCDAAAAHAGPELACIAASLVPTPVGDVSGRRVAAFTTAPDHVAPIVERELRARGADVALVSCNLARREPLARDLAAAIQAGVDAVVVEIKAAAIDSVTEAAQTAGIDVVFLDNVPKPHDPLVDLDVALRRIADQAIAHG